MTLMQFLPTQQSEVRPDPSLSEGIAIVGARHRLDCATAVVSDSFTRAELDRAKEQRRIVVARAVGYDGSSDGIAVTVEPRLTVDFDLVWPFDIASHGTRGNQPIVACPI